MQRSETHVCRLLDSLLNRRQADESCRFTRSHGEHVLPRYLVRRQLVAGCSGVFSKLISQRLCRDNMELDRPRKCHGGQSKGEEDKKPIAFNHVTLDGYFVDANGSMSCVLLSGRRRWQAP